MADRQVILKLLELHDLPTLPVIMVKILETTGSNESCANDLAHVLERDHAVSARMLRLANSAFYGLSHRVDTVRQAVVVLGFNETRCLALSTSVFDAFSVRQQPALDPEDFWMHSFGAARVAQTLSDRYCRGDNAESCFTAGLLHDIGKYVLALTLKGDYESIVEQAQSTGRPLSEVESERLGLTHMEVGRWLADKWRFPDLILDVIGYYREVNAYPGGHKSLIAAVALADVLSAKARFGFAGDSEDPAVDPQLLDILGMPHEDVDTLMAELEPLRTEIRRFLNLLEEP